MNKKKTSFIALAFAGIVALTAQGCATSDVRGNDSVKDEFLNRDVEYTINKGDRLGDISNAITGKVSLWKEIAAFNNISDPKALRVGDVIIIPASLIPVPENSTVKESTLEQKNLSKKQSIAAASNSSTQSSIASTGTLAVVQSGANSENKPADVIIQPVSINRKFELTPIDESSLRHSALSAAPQVKVIGSYYPKGIYEEPASYATLMMRVAPGTVFQLESEVNDWYKVVTNEGVGYLRINDGVIVDN